MTDPIRREDPAPSQSMRVTGILNGNESQDARYDSPNEGGIMRNKTSGASAFLEQTDNGSYRPQTADEAPDGMYEVTGFSVSYEPSPGAGLVSVRVRDFFPDVKTAFLSVNGSNYMLPVKGGYIASSIQLGSPIICKQDRQVYEFMNGEWKRT